MKKLFLVLFFLLFADSALAGTYYVSPTGDAAWNSCANINTPCSWQTAMANAVAGDTVYFRAGIYEPGEGHPTGNPKIYPANDGTAEAPITFQAYPGETPIIHDASYNAAPPANNTRPAMGCYQNSYIIWDGFTFEKNLDNGYQSSSIFRFESSDHCTLRNSELIGRPHIDQYNGALIHIIQSSYIYIYNNKFHGMSRDPNYIEPTVNTTAIWIFDFDNIHVYNNDFYDNYGNISTKVGANYLYIYKNHIWDCGLLAFRVNPQTADITDILMYQNVIRNCPTVLSSADLSQLTYNVKLYNNTIYNSGTGTLAEVGSASYQKHRNTEIFNNIISNQGGNSLWGRYFNTLDAGAGFPTYMDFNAFHGTGYWNMNYTNNYSTIANWRSALNVDLNSLTSDPLFVKPGGVHPEDYILQGNSPARVGRGGSYASVMGAYITGHEVIGYKNPVNIKATNKTRIRGDKNNGGNQQ